MQDKATFAVNSGAIDSKWQRSHAPVTGMRRPRGLVQRILRGKGFGAVFQMHFERRGFILNKVRFL